MKISVERLRKIIIREVGQFAQAGAEAISSEKQSVEKKVEFKRHAAGQLQAILNNFQTAEEIAVFMKAVETAGINIMNQREQAAPTAGAPPE